MAVTVKALLLLPMRMCMSVFIGWPVAVSATPKAFHVGRAAILPDADDSAGNRRTLHAGRDRLVQRRGPLVCGTRRAAGSCQKSPREHGSDRDRTPSTQRQLAVHFSPPDSACRLHPVKN